MHISELIAMVRVELSRAGYVGELELHVLAPQVPLVIRIEPDVCDPERIKAAMDKVWEYVKNQAVHGYPPVPVVFATHVEAMN